MRPTILSLFHKSVTGALIRRPASQSGHRRLVFRVFIGSQREDDIFNLRLEFIVVRLPAGEVGSMPFAYLRSFPAFLPEHVTIKVEWN
jgi:hypothetical protein